MSMRGYFDKKYYPEFERSWDDKLFRQFILERIKPEFSVLDLGAGAGIVPEMDFSGRAARLCGLDPDPRVETNPYLDEAKIGLGEDIPWPDGSFDLVFADNVLEHLADPDRVFAEVARVLKPGGRFLFKTPNRSHYMPLIARMTPLSFHRFYNRMRGRASEDTFHTHYRANTPADVTAIGKRVGLGKPDIRLIEGRPEYLRMMAATYVFGIAYERLVNRVDALERFRILLMGSLEKN
ncbi:methyltransferase domain-containing protein [Nitratireductor sp. CAU 1489]|uniref:Methyltransferase domain-containing protein n=2 Tax=Nitratireductor arenosus TaxID=2682096 RepID=A0A844QJV7_9HYPH|nr:methyltransferase domain-containing protein [Nitratireductor arenosus]